MATIVIDPGHTGGYNQGICAGFYEGNAMLKLSQHLGNILTSMGANVIYTRTTNTEDPSLTARGRMAENADLFISMHSNADGSSVRGTEVFYSLRQPETEPFAYDLGYAVSQVMGHSFRGTKTRSSTTNPTLDYFTVIQSAVAVGAKNAFLVEHGFHTNMEDCLILTNDASLQRIAAAEAAVIAQYLGLQMGCSVYYTVQSGDTLSGIARKFNVLWQDIATSNNIASPYLLFIGQRIAIPLPTETTTSCQLPYIVQSGDSLYSIAREFGVSWQNIATTNSIASPYVLSIGQRIVIPLPAGTDTGCRFIYTVQSGNSLYSIAQSYGVSWSSIAAANNITSPYMISVGQCLIIPLPQM